MVGHPARCEQRSGQAQRPGMLFFRFFIRQPQRALWTPACAQRSGAQKAVAACRRRASHALWRGDREATVIRPDDLMDRQTALADSAGKTLPADPGIPQIAPGPPSSFLTAIPISTHSSRSIAGMKRNGRLDSCHPFMPRAPR